MVKFLKLLAFGLCVLFTLKSQVAAYSGETGGLHPRLRSLLIQIERHFHRPLVVESGCRSLAHNRRIGGARESWHLRCQAADVEIKGVNKYSLARQAATLPQRGGIGTYCRENFIHIDLGPKRQWYWCERLRRFDQGSMHRATHFKRRHHGQRHKQGKHRKRKT